MSLLRHACAALCGGAVGGKGRVRPSVTAEREDADAAGEPIGRQSARGLSPRIEGNFTSRALSINASCPRGRWRAFRK